MDDQRIKREEEFGWLFYYCHQLREALINERIVGAEELIKIRDHIEHCDQRAESRMERYHLFTSYRYWMECLQKWYINTPPDEENMAIPALALKTKGNPVANFELVSKSAKVRVRFKQKKLPPALLTLEEMLTEEDKRWLRALFIDDEDEWRH